jgi:hypothetical protein
MGNESLGKAKMVKRPSRLFILMLLLSLQSCALVTSYKSFSLERDPSRIFPDKKTFSGKPYGVLFFFPDGTFLLFDTFPSRIEDDLTKSNYRIYKKLSDPTSVLWGVYQVEQDSILIELLEKVHQAGFMGITRWKAVLKNKGKELEVLPGPVNRKVRMPYYPTFSYKGNSYFEDSTLQDIKINPAKAWVNK